ncbi:MAG: excinuclease ABC subunit C, partial [Deltaproteobacteria bacterium]|nr:excinuclease ABC subunit C [Deltaproteobacteria bacterium]
KITKAELEKDQERVLETLKDQLRLARIPRKIEAFDISNLHGGYAVGAMVAFEDGKPNKDRYRHFKIKTVEGADDYGMMYEVLLRRYRRALEESNLPDMVLLDGGKGQLNVAQEVFKELQIKGVDLVSLAKGKIGVSGESSLLEKAEEKVFRPQVKEPFRFMKNSPVIHLLDRVRDEAHRFAITYHKKVRKKETIRSVLEDIPGIGRVRQRELLNYFGSVDKIKEVSLETLAKVPKMDLKSSQRVYKFFHPDPI